ncbi:amidohydrolase [Francisella sp. Scap27]|uniref:M20 aminoacylase family protein n=1 Tax=Francisella sp. Scap27 TaxID=2589986 RepID=UPI0015BAC446|nr:M20 aminoacylase family protein [Francisella sp. Scap27]QLE79376.1 amidohydrolase [Francisella sp. Scap27]
MILLESELHKAMRDWRRDIHRHPETAYEEHRTSAKVAELLTSFGLDVVRGLAITGIVATLKGRLGDGPLIGLRADMDALNLQELNTFSHCSHHDGKMHACGHDGHTAMLLGAAKYLADAPDFSGTVVFIFQPAEEGEAGAKSMIADGLFDDFNVDAVYGMHNWPGLEEGKFATHNGPVMAGMDLFDITIIGKGGHAGMPHLGIDPIAAAGQLINSLQNIVSREIPPLESGVISITKMSGGEAYNVIPNEVTLSGTVRSFSAEIQNKIEDRMRQQVESLSLSFGAKGNLDYRRIYPATINDPKHFEICTNVATSLVGNDNVDSFSHPSMGSEDFAFMLEKRPGAYIWIGNGVTKDGASGLHNPFYDFNDNILVLGANYWVNLVQKVCITS